MTSPPGASSIFTELYRNEPFVDRFALNPARAVDVIVPVMHANELWRRNLQSAYREIPVNRLLISDGGSIDDSIAIAQDFPRVTVFDHRQYTSLGYCLRKLIESVQTEWFVYLHSDVYLAPGWFDSMELEKSQFDWFESSQHTVILAEWPHEYQKGVPRAFSGGQMGRRAAFDKVLPAIDDDFLYRNEDIILADMVQRAGYRYGRAGSALIYHQQMEKKSRWLRSIERVQIEVRKSAEEDLREKKMQLYGLLKYMKPDPATLAGHSIIDYIYSLRIGGHLDWAEFRAWVEKVNPGWWPIIQRARTRHRLRAYFMRAVAAVTRLLQQGAASILRMLGL